MEVINDQFLGKDRGTDWYLAGALAVWQLAGGSGRGALSVRPVV